MFGGGGFGGDGGAQFAGGGFMPSQAPEAGYGGGGGSGGNKRGNVHTLRTFTIRQLAKDLANTDDDCLMVDGVELGNVCVIGRILSVQDRGSNLMMVVSDGTGELEVAHWLNEEAEQAMQSKKAELRQGVYIKAHGHISASHESPTKKLHLNAFNVRAITNFNEVTYHFLRTIFEHLHLTKGGAGAAQGMAAAGGFGNPVAGGYGGAPQQQQQQPMGGATMFAGAGGADGIQSAIINILQQSNTDQGLHVNEVHNKLSGQYNRGQIEQAFASMMNDALVYNTVDDFHYKLT